MSSILFEALKLHNLGNHGGKGIARVAFLGSPWCFLTLVCVFGGECRVSMN